MRTRCAGSSARTSASPTSSRRGAWARPGRAERDAAAGPGPRDDHGRRQGRAAPAAHPRALQVGGAVRRAGPARRCRAVELHELRAPVERASSFGVLRVDRRGCVAEFAEKPQAPAPMPDTPASALVSMGNYLFSRQALTDALLADARRSTDHDFGRSIIPELVAGGRVYAYDFQTNEVPGVKPYEEPAYWRD